MAISADVKLYCYNDALRIIGSRSLSSLSENREPRRALDRAWGDGNEGVIHCLEQAGWNFAIRTARLDFDSGIEPAFGLQYAYSKPDDLVRVEAISADEYFGISLNAHQYVDEGGYWYSDIEPLYARMVSSHTDFGLNTGLWPVSFKKFVGAYLADQVGERLTGSRQVLEIARAIMVEQKAHAKSRDAMDEGVKYPPLGSWAGARVRGSVHSRRDDIH